MHFLKRGVQHHGSFKFNQCLIQITVPHVQLTQHGHCVCRWFNGRGFDVIFDGGFEFAVVSIQITKIEVGMGKRWRGQSFDGFLVEFLGTTGVVFVKRPADVVEKGMGLDGVVEAGLDFVGKQVLLGGFWHIPSFLKGFTLGTVVEGLLELGRGGWGFRGGGLGTVEEEEEEEEEVEVGVGVVAVAMKGLKGYGHGFFGWCWGWLVGKGWWAGGGGEMDVSRFDAKFLSGFWVFQRCPKVET